MNSTPSQSVAHLTRQGFFLALATGLGVATVCSATERVRIAVDNVAEIGIKDCIRTAAEAFDQENLDAYLGCFASKQRPKIRRKVALLFVEHEIGLELLDSHLVNETDGKAELAVKYRMTLTEPRYDIVSLIRLAREDDRWRIVGESIQSNSAMPISRSYGGSGEQVFRFGGGGEVLLNPQGDDGLPADIGRRPGGGCPDGRCRLPR